MIIYIDIDDTICKTNGSLLYQDSVPIPENIKKANKFYEEGHTVIYWTGRGYKSGLDWREVTESQFEEWGVKYHELKFGKPYDLIIDDKALNAMDW
ncbi:MAG: hypothetical protein WC119_02150 [Synergistaceae bacterium]